MSIEESLPKPKPQGQATEKLQDEYRKYLDNNDVDLPGNPPLLKDLEKKKTMSFEEWRIARIVYLAMTRNSKKTK